MAPPSTVEFEGTPLKVSTETSGGNTFVTVTDLGKVVGQLPNIQNSHAVIADDGTIYVSGICGLCPGPDGKPAMVSGGPGPETLRTMKLLEVMLRACGAGPEHVTMVHVYLVDNTDERFAAMNNAYLEYWGKRPRPGRITTGTSGLVLGACVEIDLVAKIPASKL